MTEEVVKPEVKVEKEEAPKIAEPQMSPLEERATVEGWKPKEQWVAEGGDPEEWRPAREFIDRGELFRRIEEDKKELRNLRKTLGLFKQHYEKVKETEFKRALDALKEQKKAALVEGDADKLLAIEDEMLATRERIAQEQALARQPIVDQETVNIHPDFQNWVQRNAWYKRDPEAKAFADSLGIAYKQTNPSMSAVAVLAHVEQKVKQAYPQFFKNPRREAAPSVEGGSAPRKAVADSFELTDEERRTMSRFIKAGALTEEQYIKDLKKAKGVS